MSFRIRVGLLIGLIASALGGQIYLVRHLSAAGDLPQVPLRKPLGELPDQLGEWHGQDTEIDERALYGDDHLQRTYYHPGRRQSLTAWIVYSGRGEDRGHHPEVCMAVAGRPEDTSVRRTLEVPGHSEPVQQYRFGGVGQAQWVFYWYYTLPSENERPLDELQRLYQRFRKRPSSVTLEVFAPTTSSSDVEGAQEFVRLLDAAIQEHIGAGAVRGSSRTPVVVVDAEEPH